MGIYKQKGSKYWWFRIHVPGSGRARPRTLRGSCRTTDRAVAEAVEHAMRMAVGKAAPADALHRMIDALLGVERPAGLPLGAVGVAYEKAVARAARRLSAHTLRDRVAACRRVAEWAGVHRPAVGTAEEVDRGCAAAFSEWLAVAGLQPKTRRNIVADLGTVWHELARGRDGMPPNPWPLALPDAARGERGRPFSRVEEALVLAAADAAGLGWGLACRIARHTGLRYGDVARLRWGQVDLEEGLLRVAPSKTARWGVALALPLPGALREALGAAGGLVGGNGGIPEGQPLFPELSEAYPHAPWGHEFGRVLDAAGLDRRQHTFHGWRHTFRTRLAEAGCPDEIAKRLGGWTNDATAARYDHAGRGEELRAAVEAAAV